MESILKILRYLFLIFLLSNIKAVLAYSESDNQPNSMEEILKREEDNNHIITSERLREIRSEFLYWFFDEDDSEKSSDYQRDIHASQRTVHKNLPFNLPFFGFLFNYTRISIDGYLGFSDLPKYFTYPLVFPTKDWPNQNDPSFIGIFFSKCRIGKIYPNDSDKRTPGVYFRVESNLNNRTDRMGVEVRERTMWDIREGIIGAETFVPKHVIIATWKNLSFSGGIDNSLYTTNTFQIVITTDEVHTYAIFNYAQIAWTCHTEAGGDVISGSNGVPAFVGFNAGNGTRSYEYKPYSQSIVVTNLLNNGYGNGFPGRHIFRIDEEITLGVCENKDGPYIMPLNLSPKSGNMLGGTIVNITGPCFNPSQRLICQFGSESVFGAIVSLNRAMCIQPPLKKTGYIYVSVYIGRTIWTKQYFVEPPSTATEKIYFSDKNIFKKSSKEIQIQWNPTNLTNNLNSNVNISIWGYNEKQNRIPYLTFIDTIESSATNNGSYTILPENFRHRNTPEHIDIEFGFLQIKSTNSLWSSTLWSRPIPLAWYFAPQWQRLYGKKWQSTLCKKWFKLKRPTSYFINELPLCPCKLESAIFNKGQFSPDLTCDQNSNATCLFNTKAIHCVKSGQPSKQGSEQQCCYNRSGRLTSFCNSKYGSRPKYSHDIAQGSLNMNNHFPTLSQWYHDNRPYFSCCYWQNNKSNDCKRLRFERGPAKHCSKYQEPIVLTVLSDATVETIDNFTYKFDGVGEYVLAKIKTNNGAFEVQGRFQTLGKENKEIHLTSITTTTSNKVANIEVSLRPPQAQWRYKLNVYDEGQLIYFDRPSMKFQYFDGITVYTPTNILNQSEVIIMHSSGAGVYVTEKSGLMEIKIYIPKAFQHKTVGLVGNWISDADNSWHSDEITTKHQQNEEDKIKELKKIFLTTFPKYFLHL